jgi:hypothetical protein
MTSRQGFYVTLVGLSTMVSCAAAGLSFPDFGTDTSGSGEPNMMATILILLGFAGFVVTMVGLVAGIASLVQGSDRSVPREGLRMALVGLVIGVLCVSATYLMPFFYLGASFGLGVMIAGLIMATVGAFTKQTR